MAKEEKNEQSEKKEEAKPKEIKEVKPPVEEKEVPTSKAVGVPTGSSDKRVGESVGKEKKEEAPQEVTSTTQPAQAQSQGSNNNGWKIFCCSCLGCLGLIFAGLLILFVSLGGVMGVQSWIAALTSGVRM